MGGPREAGTSEQYRQAVKALYDMMEKYQPEYIIVWGNRLWDKLGRALDRWLGYRCGWLSCSRRSIYLGERQKGEGDGCKPSVGGLFVGLLPQGDKRILELKETV